MKKTLLILGLLATQSVFAENIALSEVHFVTNDNNVNNSVISCKDTECELELNKIQDYLVNITNSEGKTVSDKEINQTYINVYLLKLDKSNILEVKYREKNKKGYFNGNQLDIYFSKSRVSEESNYEKTFYIPITNEKKYIVKIDNNKSINVTLK